MDMNLGVIGLELVAQAGILGREADPLLQNGVPLRAGFAGQNLHPRVRQLGDVEQRALATAMTERAHQMFGAVAHCETHEGIGDEAVRDHLLEALANLFQAGRGVG